MPKNGSTICINLSAIIYQEDAVWFAHCLEMDIVGSEFLASDLRPALDPTTPLASLHRGAGVALGQIQLTDRAGNAATIAPCW